MIEESLSAGVSVVYDMNALRLAQRRFLRDIARKAGAETMLLWQQIDPESARMRAVKRDRRRDDDKYAMKPDTTTLQKIAGELKNPEATEENEVVNGKHHVTQQYNKAERRRHE